MTRNLLILPAILAATLTVDAVGQASPRFAPSGRGRSEIVVMLPDGTPDSVKAPGIRVDFGQPHLRGRTLHGDSLVPYDKVWRTGANGTTMFETDLDLRIGGATLPKGKYALFTIPGQREWQLVLQRDIGQDATTFDSKNNVVNVPMKRRHLDTAVESLSMWLVPSPSGLGGELRIVWGNSEVSVPFEAAGRGSN